MRHEWQRLAYGTTAYDNALSTVLADTPPDIIHYPETSDFGFVIDDNGNEVTVDIDNVCRRCGSVMLSDPGGDYVAIVGKGDYYECP